MFEFSFAKFQIARSEGSHRRLHLFKSRLFAHSIRTWRSGPGYVTTTPYGNGERFLES
jgi:hypothetical protein